MSSEAIKLNKDQEAHAMALHQQATVVDACALYHVLQPKHLERLQQGGVNVILLNLTSTIERDAIDQIIEKYAQIAAKPDEVTLTLTYPALETAVQNGKLAVFFGTQNCQMLGENIGLLRLFYQLGLRSFQPTYSFGNLLGAGCIERSDYGLTYYGIDVISEVNELNCMVDVSHCGDTVTDEAIDLATYPVATHVNARALSQTTRNKTDDQLKAIAEKDGVIGVNAVANLVSQPNPDAARDQPPTTKDYLAHVDYMVNLVGVDHVGMGLDQVEIWETDEYDPANWEAILATYLPTWTQDKFGIYRQRTLPNPQKQFGTLKDVMTIPHAIPGHADIPNVTRGLVARGYADQDILKILGDNWLRVFKKVLR
jgi:membrane dipeptidase